MGRRPIGLKALTPAEKQARYRARLAKNEPILRWRKPSSRKSRPQRWRDAVAELVDLQSEYSAWLDNLPDFARDTPVEEKLQAIVDLDLSELEAIEPPKGFGRD
jgi:hypothetical protein